MNIFKKLSYLVGSSAVLFVTMAATVFATVPPVSTGQPGAPAVTCGTGNATTLPAGFLTSGFATAGSVYAGSTGTASLLHSQSTAAVSQYDVACLMLTTH